MLTRWGALALALLLAWPLAAAEQGTIEIPTTAPNPPGANPFGGPTGVASRINASIRAVASQNWGPTAPTNGPSAVPLPYQLWMDTSASPRVWKIWDGAQWVSFANLDTTAHALTIPCAVLPAETGDVTRAAGSCAQSIAPNAVTNAKLRQSAGLSVLGRSANSTGDVADLTGTANQVLRVDSGGTALGFGQVNLGSSAAVTGTLPVANGGTGATTASGFLDLFGSTRGQILYRGASAWSVLSPGTAGQVLSTGGAGADPSWASIAGSGTVTSVATGVGLSGGPITSTGTITLTAPRGDVRMSWSGTQVQVCPYNGNLLTINGVNYTVPSSCINYTPSGLTAGTLYYGYVYNNAGTLTFEASTTVHAKDASTGVEIKSGDASRTLVGMFRATGAAATADTAAQRFVRSWYNRRPLGLSNKLTARRSTTSTSFAELESAARVEWLNWADETISLDWSGFVLQTAGTGVAHAAIGIDDVADPMSMNRSDSTAVTPIACPYRSSDLAEGYHRGTLMMASSSGSVTVATGPGSETTVNKFTSIVGTIGR